MKERNKGLDFVKGCCILIVVICHTVYFENLKPPIDKIFSAVFLTSFFAVTGYISYSDGKCDAVKKIKRKFNALITPYVKYSIICILWHSFIVYAFDCREVSPNYFGGKLILRDIFCFISGLGIGTLWFLPTLFFSYSLFQLMLSITSKKYRKIVFGIVFVICFILSNLFENMAVPGNGMIAKFVSEYMDAVHRLSYGLGYMLLGWIIHDLYCRIEKKERYILGVLALTGVLAVLGGIFNIQLVFESCLVIGFIIFCVFIFSNENKALAAITKALRPIVFCGEKSLEIMVIHYLLLPIEQMWLRNILGEPQSWLLFGVNLFTTIGMIFAVDGLKLMKNRIGKSV